MVDLKAWKESFAIPISDLHIVSIMYLLKCYFEEDEGHEDYHHTYEVIHRSQSMLKNGIQIATEDGTFQDRHRDRVLCRHTRDVVGACSVWTRRYEAWAKALMGDYHGRDDVVRKTVTQWYSRTLSQ